MDLERFVLGIYWKPRIAVSPTNTVKSDSVSQLFFGPGPEVLKLSNCLGNVLQASMHQTCDQTWPSLDRRRVSNYVDPACK